MSLLPQQRENINKEREGIIRIKFFRSKNINNWKEKFTRGFQQQIWDGRISKLEDKSSKIIQFKKREKKMEWKWIKPKRPLGNHQKYQNRDFPAGPEARSLFSQCRRSGCNPWSEDKIPHTATRSSHTAAKILHTTTRIKDPTHTTKTWHSQTNKLMTFLKRIPKCTQ